MLIHLYPRAWRARYGDELLALIGDRTPGWRESVNVLRSVLEEWAGAAVRRWLRPHAGEATVRRIARVVVHAIAACSLGVAIFALFPTVVTLGAAALGLAPIGAAERQFGFLRRHSWPVVAGSSVLFLATLGVVAPLLLGLKLTMTRLGRRPVWIARVATAVAFVLPSLLWQSWLDGPSPIPLIHVGLSLGAAGVVMASAVFPVPRTA